MKQNEYPTPTLRLANDFSSPDGGEEKGKKISRAKLINSLNRINFHNGKINLRFKHNKYRSFITLPAIPLACSDKNLKCLWSDTSQHLNQLQFYTFDSFSYTDGLVQVQVPAEFLHYSENDVHLELPENSYETYRRETRRYNCKDIRAQISQDGWFANGLLKDFTVKSLAVTFRHESTLLSNEFDSNNHVHLVLKKGNEFLFSGSCSILRKLKTSEETHLVLRPLSKNVNRIKSKEYRSERLVLTPLPTIRFTHPLIQKTFNLSLNDISGLGFSVEENIENAVLLPGMVIPDLQISFMHGFSIQCKSQVLYRNVIGNTVKCGFVILDMDMHDYLKLSSLIHQAKNKYSLISTTNLEPEALWEFFFETGFVYPEKYMHISEKKETFKRLFQKLYSESSQIAQHVVYQDKGSIYGHVSMFRYYQSTWLMHHYAATKSPKHKAGLVVMEQILEFINEYHTIQSSRMNYIACYFRKKNRFADRVFGGAAKHLEDQQKCSLDDFAYFHHELQDQETKHAIDGQWSITKTDPDDLHILKQWYKLQSGGLMIQGFDLTTDAENIDKTTNLEYEKEGFTRSRKIFSLKRNDELMAIFIVNISDLGMNLSDLTNCIQALIIEPKGISREHFIDILSHLSVHHGRKEIPVLVYPETFAEDRDIPYDKTYTLTVLDLNYISPYLQFMKTFTAPRHKKMTSVVANSSNA